MKTNKLIALILILCFGISSISLASTNIPVRIGSEKKSKSESDTSIVNRYSRKALSYVSYSKNAKYMKANIDTAETLCSKENIEFPAPVFSVATPKL